MITKNDFLIRSINKAAYLTAQGLAWRPVINEEDKLVFAFNKNEELYHYLDCYTEATRGEEVNVDLSKFLDALSMLNGSIRDFRNK